MRRAILDAPPLAEILLHTMPMEKLEQRESEEKNS
jgi:hypothetical protein